MAHRGRLAAPRAILAQGVGVNPPLILHQLEVSRKTIHLTITANDETCLKWLAEKGLVSNTMNCHRCQIPMALINKQELSDGKTWRCRECSTETTIRSGSFFEGSHLSFTTLVELLYWWTTEAMQKVVMRELDIAAQTIVDWFSFIREVCWLWVEDNAEQIGGIDPVTEQPKIVEIDESLFFQRKYHRAETGDIIGSLEGSSVGQDGASFK